MPSVLQQHFDFSRTMQHPLASRHVIEMLPASWVASLGNTKTSDKTDLDGTITSELVGMEELWNDIKQHGMRDPFILSAGRHTQTCRLEAGNHRIKVFLLNDVAFVPSTVLVADDCVISPRNGLHAYKKDLKIPFQLFVHGFYDDRVYMKPSDVFCEISAMKSAGMLPPVFQIA